MQNKEIIHREEVPKLSTIAIAKVAENFNTSTDLSNLPYYFQEAVYNLVSIDLPHLISFNAIDSEIYWKRVCSAKFPAADTRMHGNSWKQAFAENYAGQLLNNFDEAEDGDAIEELKEQLQVLNYFVFTLDVKYFTTTETMMSFILSVFPNLSYLTLKYSPNLARDRGVSSVTTSITRNHLNSY